MGQTVHGGSNLVKIVQVELTDDHTLLITTLCDDVTIGVNNHRVAKSILRTSLARTILSGCYNICLILYSSRSE